MSIIISFKRLAFSHSYIGMSHASSAHAHHEARTRVGNGDEGLRVPVLRAATHRPGVHTMAAAWVCRDGGSQPEGI